VILSHRARHYESFCRAKHFKGRKEDSQWEKLQIVSMFLEQWQMKSLLDN
jgi:hypothetical protein